MDSYSFLVERPIAHRGLHDGNAQRFENSLAAFEAAKAGNYAIELDVRLSSDGHAIVFHDETLQRLTGEEGRVDEKSAAELARVRLGDTDSVIPTLKDVLDAVGGSVPLIIEMKDIAAHNHRLANAVAEDLANYGGPAAAMSFNHSLIAEFRRLRPEVPVGLTAEGIGRNAIDVHHAALDLKIDFVSYHVRALPNRFVSHVRETLGLPVITWTVRTPHEVAATREHADQMTFEGFDPDRL